MKLTGRTRLKVKTIGWIFKRQILALQIECTDEYLDNGGGHVSSIGYRFWRDARVEDITTINAIWGSQNLSEVSTPDTTT